MAHIKSIHLFESGEENKEITAYIALKPSGQARVDFTLPDKFYDCILNAAQAAADLHEQQMKAAILAEKSEVGL